MIRSMVFAAELVAFDILRFELSLHDNLRRDSGMVRSRQPQRVGAAHAVIARQRIHDGLVERVTHVQGAGDIGRRQLNAKRFGAGLVTGVEITAGFPQRIPLGFDGFRIKALGEFGHSVVWMAQLDEDYSGWEMT